MKLSHLPLRLASGAFILNSGVGKLSADEGTAAWLQESATRVVPRLGDLPSDQFAKLLAAGEITLGSTLLAPFIPSRLAGLGLAAFSGCLLTMYFRTPEATEADGVRPSASGTALAKDSWLVAIALALMIDGGGKKKKKK